MDTIEGITDSATLETSRLPEDAALPVLTGVVAFNRLLEELVVWEEADLKDAVQFLEKLGVVTKRQKG